MKRILAVLCMLLSISTMAATLTPIQLLNPAGSTSGQVIASTGPTAAPAWTTVTLSGLGGLAKANNLSDLVSVSTARTNLGLGTSAVVNTGTSGAVIPLLSTANTWTLAQAFTVRPTFNGNTPYDTGNLTIANYAPLASPTFTGTVTTAALNATTLNASGNDALLYQTTNALSIPNNTATTVTTWTKVSDRVNTNFNAGTGVFTAPVTGQYWVAANLTYAVTTGGSGIIQDVRIVGNGVTLAHNQLAVGVTTTVPQSVSVSGLVSLTAGQTIVIQAFQNSGSAVVLAVGSAYNNAVSIARLP